jgi:hypothetical protein
MNTSEKFHTNNVSEQRIHMNNAYTNINNLTCDLVLKITKPDDSTHTHTYMYTNTTYTHTHTHTHTHTDDSSAPHNNKQTALHKTIVQNIK